jgi:hypothetical protein
MTAVRNRHRLKATPPVLTNYVDKPSRGDREPKGLATAAKPGGGMDQVGGALQGVRWDHEGRRGVMLDGAAERTGRWVEGE